LTHGSVAMQLWCGGMFSNHMTATCPQSLPVKIWKIGQYLVKIWTVTKCDVFWDTV